MRDMTPRQFMAALERHDMKPAGFMGYIEIGIENHRISVCKFNAGNNRRAQLAYLLKSKAEWESRLEAEQEAKAIA